MADEVSSEQKFALIEAVRKRRPLYDRLEKDYHILDRKNKLWAEVASEPAVKLKDAAAARDVFEKMRILYKRNSNKKPKSGDGAAREVKWQYFEAMNFLAAFSEPRAESQSTLQLNARAQDPEESQQSNKSENSSDAGSEGKEEQKSVFRTPSSKRFRNAEAPLDKYFKDTLDDLKARASQPKTRNQIWADGLAVDLEEFPAHFQPLIRKEIDDLVHLRRGQCCPTFASAASSGSSSPGLYAMSPLDRLGDNQATTSAWDPSQPMF